MNNTRSLLCLLSLGLMCLFTVVGASAETCPLPPGPGVHICLPFPDGTVSSPVEISASAGAHVGRHITAMRIYIDNQAVYTSDSDPIDTSLNVATGSHFLAVVAYDNLGASYRAAENFTVVNSPAACLPDGPGAKICSPPPNSTVSSPVLVSAGARPTSGRITAIRLYIDNVAVFSADNGTARNFLSINTSLNLSAGTHRLVEVAYQSIGGTQTASESFTVTF